MSQKIEQKYKGRIRNRLIIYYSTPLLFLLITLSFFYDYSARRGLENEMGMRLENIARELAEKLKTWQVQALTDSSELENDATRQVVAKIISDNLSQYQVERIYLFDLNNRSLADSNRQTSSGSIYFKHELDRAEIGKAITNHSASSKLFRGNDGNLYKSAYAPILLDGKPLAIVGVEASATFFKALREIRVRVLIFLVSGILIVILISVGFSRRIVRPIEKLASATRQIGEGNLEKEIRLKVKGEIGFLAKAIDEMRKNIITRDLKSKMMLRGIAHELRNPLGAIELHSGLIAEEVKNNNEASECAKSIQQDVIALKKLIEEFLDFAKEPVLEIDQLKSKEFIENSLLPLQSELKAKKITTSIDIAKEARTMRADPDNLRRALLNIYLNALQAIAAEGGKILIELERQQKTILIKISDNGPGIEEKHLDKLFAPFFTTKKKGSGLGLAFSEKIISAHQGSIEYHSSALGGASFYIYLPA